jgi:hypothetical protein
MTADDFRRLALSLPHASESAHHGHPDFRLKGKIFATLGYPDTDWAMVKLTPAQQRRLKKAEPDTFRPVKGAWGVKGATNVILAEADAKAVRAALVLAWKNVATKGLIEEAGDLGDEES